jgi:hypothetical protein
MATVEGGLAGGGGGGVKNLEKMATVGYGGGVCGGGDQIYELNTRFRLNMRS